MSTSDEIRRADFEYLTGRPASAEEIAGSGTIRMHYENDGSIRQMACSAVDYHDAGIRAKLEVRYPPENSPLVKALVDLAMSAARKDPDGSKLAASKALAAAADAAVKRHWPTGRYLRALDLVHVATDRLVIVALEHVLFGKDHHLGAAFVVAKQLVVVCIEERSHPSQAGLDGVGQRIAVQPEPFRNIEGLGLSRANASRLAARELDEPRRVQGQLDVGSDSDSLLDSSDADEPRL